MTRGIKGSGAKNPHGTRARYRSDKCRCAPCTRANTKACTLYLLNPRPYPDATGTRRRIQALAAIGWSCSALAREMGCSGSQVSQIQLGTSARVLPSTADMVAEVYERLSMRVPKKEDVRVRNHARRNGWVPPLAWDNIDDPDEVPCLGADVPATEADPVLIERLMTNGQADVPINERPVVVAELVARGMADPDIAHRIGVWPETVLRIRQRHGIAPAIPRSGTRAA